MESGPVTVKTGKLRKLQSARQRLLQRHEHHSLVSCLAGLYSCRWRRYQLKITEPGECCCSVWECTFYPVLLAAFCFSFVFLYLWSQAQNDYNNFHWYAFTKLEIWFLWSIVVLVVASLFFSYILLLLIMALILVSEGQQLYLHWCHKIGTVFILIFSAVALSIITLMWNVQWTTVILSMQATAPFMHVVALLFMVLLSWPVALYTFRLNKKVLKAMVLVPFLALLLFLSFIPLGMYSPCIQEEGMLGPKPALIGHRGAPMMAPENTHLSFLKTIEHGGDGLETDVRISFDGIPFLMHDKTLARTTNVLEVMPENASVNADMFTWDVLRKLNAGKWFFQNKPFLSLPTMSPSHRRKAETQTIYRLTEFLDLAEQKDKLVIFDLNRPSPKHPYRDTWIKRILYVVLKESTIRPHLVLWLENTERSQVQAVAPGFQQTFNKKAPLDVLQNEKIVKLNLNYRDISAEDIRMYAENNITTNFYVINELWLFSLAWCAGAHSVTTNAVHTFKDVTKPVFLMTPRQYRIMWTLTDVFSGFLICLVFFFHWWREKNAPYNRINTGASGTYHEFRTGLKTRQAKPDVA